MLWEICWQFYSPSSLLLAKCELKIHIQSSWIQSYYLYLCAYLSFVDDDGERYKIAFSYKKCWAKNNNTKNKTKNKNFAKATLDRYREKSHVVGWHWFWRFNLSFILSLFLSFFRSLARSISMCVSFATPHHNSNIQLHQLCVRFDFSNLYIVHTNLQSFAAYKKRHWNCCCRCIQFYFYSQSTHR